MTDSDFLQIDSDALITDEPSLASMIVNLATDQDIRARVHELLMLAERPAPQEERRRDRRYPYPYPVRMTPVGEDGRTPSGLVRVNQPSRTERGYHFPEAGIGESEATLAASEHAGSINHRGTDVPGAVHHDRPGGGVAVGRVESIETDGAPMATDVHRARSVGSGRSRV